MSDCLIENLSDFSSQWFVTTGRSANYTHSPILLNTNLKTSIFVFTSLDKKELFSALLLFVPLSHFRVV
jgi:hypothetical protein